MKKIRILSADLGQALHWDYDEDRSRKGYGPENIFRLRRFAIGLIKSKGVRSVPRKMRKLTRNVRLVFDYLRMTAKSSPQPASRFRREQIYRAPERRKPIHPLKGT